MWAVIIQATEGPYGTKRWRKSQFSLSFSFWAGMSVFLGPLNFEFLVLGPLDSKLYTIDSPDSQAFVNWITSPTFLLFQLADSRFQDSWAFIGLCEPISTINLPHIYQSIYLCVIYWLYFSGEPWLVHASWLVIGYSRNEI